MLASNDYCLPYYVASHFLTARCRPLRRETRLASGEENKRDKPMHGQSQDELDSVTKSGINVLPP
jgi:hypothetical protein